MKKQFRLSTLTVGLVAGSLLAFSTAHAAGYKGEASYKGEVAAPCPQPLTLKDGFYVGGQVGYDSYRVRASTAFSGNAGESFSDNPVYNATGWVGGLFLGYGQYFQNSFYLGGEVFGNDSGADVSRTSTSNFGSGLGSISTTDKFDVNGSYGIALLPGMKLNDATLGYIRLGYNRARFHVSSSGSENIGVASSASNSFNSWQGGFNYGLGMETAFYENWSARAEYSHTNFSSFSNRANSATSFNPSDNQFMLGLIYHFA